MVICNKTKQRNAYSQNEIMFKSFVNHHVYELCVNVAFSLTNEYNNGHIKSHLIAYTFVNDKDHNLSTVKQLCVFIQSKTNTSPYIYYCMHADNTSFSANY